MEQNKKDPSAFSGKTRYFDMEDTSVLLCLLSFCVIAVVFSFRDGSEVMFYAWFPMLAAAVSSAVSLSVVDAFVTAQVRARMERKKFSNALIFYHSAIRGTAVFSLILFFIFFVLSGFLGTNLLGYSLIAPVFRTFTPAICMTGFIGCMKGLLRGIGQERIARLSLCIQTAVFFVLGLVFGLYGSEMGQKVGVLLRNDGIGAVYCACGIGLGFTISVLVTLLWLLVVSSIAAGRIRHERDNRDDLMSTDHNEDGRELFRYYCSNILPGTVPALIYLLGMMIGYRLWLNGQGSERNLVISKWGGYIGVGYPVVTGCALCTVIPFTYQLRRLCTETDANWTANLQRTRKKQKSRKRILYGHLSLLLRLSAYVSIPLSAFLFGAAKEVAELFPHLTFRSMESAILSVKAGSFQVFLLQSSILMMAFFWRARYRRMVIIALSAGFFAQIVLLVILNLAGVGITMNPWSSDVFCLVFLGILYCLGRTEIIRGMKPSWFADDVLISICSLIAVIPVELLNDWLLLVMNPFPAFLIQLAVFYVIFIITSIVLRAADLKNIHRIPGGNLILSIAVLLGAAEK